VTWDLKILSALFFFLLHHYIPITTDMKAEEEQEEDYVENELVKSKSAVLGKGTMSHTRVGSHVP